MDLSDLTFATAGQLARLVAKREVSPVELVEAFLRRIERRNPRLNAYLTVTADRALGEARRAERELRQGQRRGPLHGIPISLKDNIWTKGVRTTAGSKILADFIPAEDATAAARLRRAGAILLGKTNMHEFAYGVTTENPHYGPTRNPWDLERVPGGSSGGSAAAIADGLCCASVGTDTGGSIRIPAALCGIVGLKPTSGRVSGYGVVPLAPSFDQTGPLARSVSDAAILLTTIAGRDPRDPATFGQPRMAKPRELLESTSTWRKASRRAKARLGWPRNYFWEKLDEEVRRIVAAAARELEDQGYEIEEVSLPRLDDSVEPSTHIALAEAAHYHQSAGYFPAQAADYGEDVRKRLEMGTEVRAVDYLKALALRQQVRADFDAAFGRVEAIVSPTVPIAAPRIGEKLVTIGAEQESVRSALLRLNRPANFTGLPALSLPCGFTREGLPVGLQLIGPMWGELNLLRIGYAYEQLHEWSLRRPPEN